MLAAVVDTNVLVSGLMRPGSWPALVLQDIVLQRLQPVVCDAVMSEYRDVLLRPRLRLPARDVDTMLALMASMANWVQVPDYTGALDLPDPADWPFMACALAVGCPVITGNLKHFPAEVGVKVMSAREWAGRSPAAG